jgi:drug/metabolite transporter (DMT)-like permease
METAGTLANERKGQGRVYVAMTLGVVAVSSSSIIITRLERGGVEPLIIAFYRMLLATLLLAIPALKARRNEIRSLKRGDVVLLIVSGLFLAIHFGSWISSLEYIPISSSVLLVASHPLFVVIAAAVFLGEVPTKRVIAGTVLGLAGAAVILGEGFAGLNRALLGDVLALIGALSTVVYLLIGRRVRARLSLLAYVVPAYATCCVLLFGWALALGNRLTGYGAADWLCFLGLAVVPTILGHTVLNWAIKHVAASAISTALLGEPVVASLLAGLFYAQIPSGYTVAGGCLVLIGIYLVVSRKAAPQALESAAGAVE